MMRACLLLLLMAFAKGEMISQSPAPSDIVAYAIGGVLTIRTASSEKILHVLKTTPPIGTFAISPDMRSVVFAPKGPEGNGGPLYLVSIADGKQRRLIGKPIYNKREVYAVPDFSPTGHQIVFAVRAQPRGDAVVSAGPFALLNLTSGTARELSSTLNIQGYGPAYGDSPRWSPDGAKMFFNLESDFAIASEAGLNFQDTSRWTAGQGDTFAVDWLGNSCIVYIGGKTWEDAAQSPAKILHIKTHETGELSSLLAVAPKDVTDLIAISPSVRVTKSGNVIVVRSGSSSWTFADSDRHPIIRVVSMYSDANVPSSCR